MDDLRAALNKSFDEVAATEAGSPAPQADQTGTEPPVGNGAPSSEPSAISPDTASQASAPAVDAGVPGDKQTSDTPATGEVKDDKGVTSAAPGPKGPENYDHAPGTWSAEAREGWKDLNPRVRQEVWKREKDAVRALTISTRARKFESGFHEMMQPYMGFIAAEGAQPLQAVNFMMQTAAMLRTGSTQQKAELVANVIKQWGVDVELVDEIMTQWREQGWAPTRQGAKPNPQADIQAAIRAELSPIMQRLAATQQAQDQALDSEVADDLNAFASDPKHEFFNDVREDMADLMELAQKRGTKLSLTEAYRRATLQSESVQRILSGRKTQQTAQQHQTNADRARAAAASVPGTTAASMTSAPTQDAGSIRETLERVFSQHAGS